MHKRTALPIITLIGGLALTFFAWLSGSHMLREAKKAEFDRDSNAAILQIQQFMHRQIDTLKTFQAFHLSSPEAGNFNFNNFITRVIDEKSPIQNIFTVNLSNEKTEKIEIIFDRNVFRSIFYNKESIIDKIKYNRSIDPIFTGIYEQKQKNIKMLSFSIAIDNVNPRITHDKYAVIFIDVSAIKDSISVGDIDSFMEITVSGPQTPPQMITDKKENYEAHDDTVLERVQTIQNLGGEWHFHFDRPLYGDIFGIKLVNFIVIIGISITVLASWGLYTILTALADAERERDERRLVDERRRLMEAVVTSASDGVLITRANSINYPGPEIIFVNQAQLLLTGYELEEVIGKSPRIFQSAQTDRTLLDQLRQALEAGQPYRCDLLNRTKDGRDLWIDLSIVPVRDENGIVTHFASLQRDITAQRQQQIALHQATEQAKASAHMKSEFLATMSHEIRTPLNGIIGMTNLLLDSPLDFNQRHQAETALQSAETLLHLLNDILDFSKIEAGKLDIEHIPFDLPQLVEGLIDMMAPQARRKGLEILLRIDTNVPSFIAGDPGRLRQILFNLVGNAIKFTEKGFVRVDISEPPDFGLSPDQIRLRFGVTDTGIGIGPDKLGMIFDKLSQADSSTTRQFGGSGLGLAICQQLCHLMGGFIGVESKEQVGSTFWFTIICQKTDAPDLDETSHQETAPAHSINLADYHFNSTSVLLAEDNPVNAMVFTQALEKLGCVVTHVTDGKQALETAPTGRFDLILMDCQMPVMDGYSATGLLREDMQKGLIKNIPIIALTASAMKGDREKCLAAGMDDYLTKPLDFQALVQTMARHLNRDDLLTAFTGTPTDTSENADIDWQAFDECADILGDAMPEMIGRFLTSVAGYIDKIADACEAGDCLQINKAAHPLRSSAAQIGAQRVAMIAQSIEMLTLTDHHPDWPTIQPTLQTLLPELQDAFHTADIHLRERTRIVEKN